MVGDVVTLSLSKVSLMVDGKVVWLGVTNINIESGVGEREQHQQNDDTVRSTSLLFLACH